jgi:ABC-type uncharacterized transport system permease subunit
VHLPVAMTQLLSSNTMDLITEFVAPVSFVMPVRISNTMWHKSNSSCMAWLILGVILVCNWVELQWMGHPTSIITYLMQDFTQTGS